MKIPLSSPLHQFQSHKKEIERAISEVCESGFYILGPQVEQFEKEFANYIGVPHGIGVANGTDALTLALMGVGVGQGDEVITVSHTAVATIAAIERAGATPVLVDIEPDYYCINPEKIEGAITKKTKAVIAVHLYGQAADLFPILDICKKHNLKLIEDCAQAHGAYYQGKRVGSFGDAATFSFYPTKNLGAIGDGGMVVTQNDFTNRRIRLLRQYGWRERYESSISGMNSRLDELQAALLRTKLKTLDSSNEKRRNIADYYLKNITSNKIVAPKERSYTSHVYHLFVIQIENRDELQKYLASQGIGTGIHYPIPVHLQGAYHKKIKCPGGMDITEKLSRNILSLPMFPELKKEEYQIVVEKIQKYFLERKAA